MLLARLLSNNDHHHRKHTTRRELSTCVGQLHVNMNGAIELVALSLDPQFLHDSRGAIQETCKVKFYSLNKLDSG